jgi:hypothetical protein
MAAVTASTLIAIAAGTAAAGAAVSEEQRKSASKQASKQRKFFAGQGVKEATPEVGAGARDELRRRAKARLSGRRNTIVTGDLTPPSAKKSVLG